MSTVTLSLVNIRHAPWGLLTDQEPPEMIVWLTEENPSAEIDSIMLLDGDLIRIDQSWNAGIINVSGLKSHNEMTVPSIPKSVSAPIVSPARPKVSPSETIMDVTQLMRKEADRAKVIEEKVKSRYPKIDELLVLPAFKLKKELKTLAKSQITVSFFQECRNKEINGKNRKTVIAVLVEIVQAKISAIGLDGRSGESSLSNAYYDMIEEFEDEETEVEIIESPVSS